MLKKAIVSGMAIIALGFGSAAMALGLGEIHVQSYLNDPLSAEIELLTSEPINLDTVQVKLAQEESFTRNGIKLTDFLSKMRFEILQKGAQYIIKISTKEAVKQTYLEFLIELTWPDGRLIKPYTALLDPLPHHLRSASIDKRKAVKLASQQQAQPETLEELFEPDLKVASKTTKQPPSYKATAQSQSQIVLAKARLMGQEDDENVIHTAGDEKSFRSEAFNFSFFGLHSGLVLGILLAASLILGGSVVWAFKRSQSVFARDPAQIKYPSYLSILKPAAKIPGMQAELHQALSPENEPPLENEITVKLELARTYISIQDWHSARELLAGMVATGNELEQQEVQELLASVDTAAI